MLRLAFREGVLQQGALYLDHLDRLPEEDGQASAWLKTLAHVIDEYGWLTFLGARSHGRTRGSSGSGRSTRSSSPRPT